jgi:hypothetical protein
LFVSTNSTKKILISANLSDEQWKSVVLGGTKVYPISECEIQGEAFDPNNVGSAKENTIRSIVNRRGQKYLIHDTFHILYHLVTMKRPLDKIYLYQ